jgi:hypothetical protein
MSTTALSGRVADLEIRNFELEDRLQCLVEAVDALLDQGDEDELVYALDRAKAILFDPMQAAE